MITRISERYQSEVISTRFFNEVSVKILPYFLIVNIVISITLKFFNLDQNKDILWKVFAWIVFATFIIIALIFIFKFIPKLKKYMTEPNFIIDDLFNQAGDFFEE